MFSDGWFGWLSYYRLSNYIARSNFRRKYPKYDDFTKNFENLITWFPMIASTEFEKHWHTEVDFVTPPFDISDKLMRHSLFEPSIVHKYPCQFFSNSVDAIMRNHVIKFSKFLVKSSYLGFYGENCFLVKFNLFITKMQFSPWTP